MTTALPTSVLALPPLPTRADDKRHWGGLSGGAQALSIAEIVQTHPGMVVVITHNSQTAARLEDELRFFLPDATSWPIAHFPDWETLPYDQFSPHQDIISQRLQVLSTLAQTPRGVLVISASTSAHRLAPKDWLLGQAVSLRIGQKLTIDDTRTQLDAAGYRLVDTVYEHGEFAVRGSLIDLYPMGAEHPVRIELFDDEIETLRLFDGETQRTVEAIEHLTLMPAHEFPLDKAGIRRFRDQWADTFSGDPKRCSLYTDVINRIAGNGIEYYLPLFFEHCASIFDYLPSNSLVVMEANAHEQLGHFRQEVSNRYEQYRGDLNRPLLAPERLFLADNEWFSALTAYPRITLQADALSDSLTTRAGHHQLAFSPAPALPIDSKAEQPLAALNAYLQQAGTPRVLICAETAGRRESLSELLARHDLQPQLVASWAEFLLSDAPLCLTVAALEQGLVNESFALVAESQLFGQRVAQRRRRKATSADGQAEMAIRSLSELQPGAPVVHNDHGVGRYQGLVTLDMDGTVQEFLLLEYADTAKLYVPVSQLQVISR
ncbi:MAG: CarD family transcriptional regulator, partial [Paraperlucidibaca sp.]